MKIFNKVLLLAITFLFYFSSLSFGIGNVLPEDRMDPRFRKWSQLINPKGTYLRTCKDNADYATMLNLNYHDISTGDWIIIRRKGDYDDGPGGDTSGNMIGLFSTSTTLLADEVTRLNRVPGAIATQSPYAREVITLPTWNKCKEDPVGDPDADPINLETDIPGDFWMGHTLVQVPSPYLFASHYSNYWADNSDPDRDNHLEFSDELQWNPKSPTCDNCWDDKDNWDADCLPLPELGVSFIGSDVSGSVEHANGEVKYLLFYGGATTKFVDPHLETTVCDAEKVPFVISGAEMSQWSGDIRTCRGYIGYEEHGKFSLFTGGKFNVNQDLTVGGFSSSGGSVSVFGTNSELHAGQNIYFGADGAAIVNIWDKGLVSADDIEIIGGLSSNSYVFINSGGGLLADNTIGIYDKGNVMLDNAGIAALSVYVGPGGKLEGCTGSIVSANVQGGGTIGAGCSVGKLIIDGNYTQEEGGTLQIEIGGYQLEKEYDVLEVTGVTTLGGTLQLDFINGFAPKKGDVFEFLKIAGTASGSFSNVKIKGLEDGFEYDISVENGATKLVALNDGVSSYKFPWMMFMPSIMGGEK